MALAGYGGKKVLTYQPTAPILSLAFAELANQLPTGVAQQPTVPVCWLLTPYIWFWRVTDAVIFSRLAITYFLPSRPMPFWSAATITNLLQAAHVSLSHHQSTSRSQMCPSVWWYSSSTAAGQRNIPWMTGSVAYWLVEFRDAQSWDTGWFPFCDTATQSSPQGWGTLARIWRVGSPCVT